jgi:hypothetical protein
MSDKTTCKATRKSGQPYRQVIVDENGLCALHGGHTSVEHLRRVGRRGGLRSPGQGGSPPLEYSEHLRNRISPESLAAAIESGLASDKESDKVAAARLLLAEVGAPAETAPVPESLLAPMPQERLENIVWRLVDCLGVDGEEVVRRLVEGRQITAERLVELASELHPAEGQSDIGA